MLDDGSYFSFCVSLKEFILLETALEAMRPRHWAGYNYINLNTFEHFWDLVDRILEYTDVTYEWTKEREQRLQEARKKKDEENGVKVWY
jgi:hypothetical protein